MKQHTTPGLPCLLFFCTLIIASSSLLHGAGSLNGRVFNRATNSILENVRITIEGTTLESYSDSNGHFILAGIPSGKQKLNATFTEFKSQQIEVEITDDKIAELDIYMSQSDDARQDLVLLEKYTVMAERLSAEAAALNEQKMAVIFKNVVAFEEFGEMGEGNPGEFLKFVPGVNIAMGPSTAGTASIRGLPARGTLVMMEGNQIASAFGDRVFELNVADTANISHIEVTKSPTPDMPANAIGGSINILGKSGFRSPKPQLISKIFFTGNFLDDPAPFGVAPFKKREAPGKKFRTQTINPSFELLYFHPFNRAVALTVSANYSKRYEIFDYTTKTWHYNRNQYYSINKSVLDRTMERSLASLTLDWKPSRLSTFRASAQYSTDDSWLINNSFIASTSNPINGTLDSMENAIPDGRLYWQAASDIYNRVNQLYRISYKFDNGDWKIESDISVSHSTRETDPYDGYPNIVRADIKSLYIKASGISRMFDGYYPRLSASKTQTGPYFDAYDPSEASLLQVQVARRDTANTVTNLRLNASRKLETKIPTEVKIGISYIENNFDIRSPADLYEPPPANAWRVGQVDAIAWDYSAQTRLRYPDGGNVGASWIDVDKIYNLIPNTDYLMLNEAISFYSKSVNSRLLNETVSAAFFRIDQRFFNRLRLTYGVRYERTENKGKGILDDISKTYMKDSYGNIIYDYSDPTKPKPVDIPGLSEYEKALLRYKERGTVSEKNYGDFFPSINASYALTPNIIVRSAYAKTITRPPIINIAPGIIITPPADNYPDQTSFFIDANDPALKPWTANNYDLSLEFYNIKDITFSAGVFRKDIKDFFTIFTMTATGPVLDYYGIPPEFEGSRVRTYKTVGEGAVTGCEWSYRQNLRFLPHWARGISIYANGTHMRLSGEHADDFDGFNPRIINFGIGLTRPKVIARLNVSMRGRVFYSRDETVNEALPGGARIYFAPQTIADFNIKYIINKRYSVYCVVKNLFLGSRQWERVCLEAPAGTPKEANDYQNNRIGAAITIGFIGIF